MAVVFGSKANLFICYAIYLPPIYTKTWIAELLNNALMLVLVLHKGLMTMREYNHTGIVNRLAILLVKDSALYFLVYAFYFSSILICKVAELLDI